VESATPVIAALIVVGLASLLYFGWRRRRLAAAFLAGTAVIALLWMLAFAAIRSDYRDADGWIDCWPHCTVLQDTVGTVYVFGPAAFVVLAVAVGFLALITRRRQHHR
jgi:hypothetical protein